ncbi:MAG: asparagine synthase (glutamine-hydrolyzing) [Deltaproteobacteria bacterium]|nr:asparagine synthase (glutamine-hydrolyzing) [Deltaproteobacteria bacterium]
MCGISGFFYPGNADSELISRMISSIRYRGPDEAGIYVDSDIALGHCRLSIVGLDDGAQPICNEDGTLWIVYNGEVFNYPELRSELQKKGHVFKTGTDTEVIVHLFEEYGKDCLFRVNGQFAFAIWDCLKKELFLARDRIGIRPLYYHYSGNKFCFASEIKALFADPSIPREIDPVALHQIFNFWTTLTPRTTFKGIYELPPGHYQVVRNGAIVEQKPFWNIPYYAPENRWAGTFAEAIEHLKSLLIDAIRLRLRADVPVGAYLSGGLDSSIITSLISRHFNNKLRTFSIGFQEAAFDETPFQQELVDYLGTDHSNLLISNQDIREHFPRVIRHCERPVLRTAPVPMFLLSKMVRDNHFKVVLTGEGADEVFGGYDIFKEAKIRRFWSRYPQSSCRPRLLEKLHPYIFKDPARSRNILQKFYAVTPDDLTDPFFSHRIRWKNTGKNQLFFSDDLLQQALVAYSPEHELLRRLPDGFDTRDLLSKAQYLEMDIFLSNYLLSSQGDRVAMANSLELRLPFLDFRVIDFAATLPPTWKIKALNEKYILKKAFHDVIPSRIISRIKQPYRAPIREVFFSGKSSYVEELLSDAYLKKTGYFDLTKTRHLVDKYQKSDRLITSETQNMALVGILSTQLVHYHFMDGSTADTIKPIEIQRCLA